MTFEELTRFCKLIDTYKYPKTPTLENEDSNAFRLFKGLSQGTYKSREEAIEGIFGNKGTLKKYRELKHELKEKLINTTVLMNPKHPSQSENGMEFIENNKLWSSMLILIQMKDQDFAMKFGELAYKKIRKGIATDLKFLLAYKLVTNFGSINHNKKKFKYYQKELDSVTKELNAEIKLRGLTSELTNLIIENTSIKKLKTKFYPIMKEIEELKKSGISSLIFNRYYYVLKLRYFSYTNQKQELLSLCKSNYQISQDLDANFNLYLLKYSVINKSYEDGLFYYNKVALNLINFNVFEKNYYLFLVFCYNKNYDFSNYDRLKTQVSEKKLFKNFQDSQKIIEAYRYFLEEVKNQNKNLISFKLNKFLNDVPTISRNKRNGNVSILIIHILILLLQNKRKKIIARVEALNQYCYRYLKNDETLRSNCFIKMLIVVAKAGFNRRRTEVLADKFYKKLVKSPHFLLKEIPVVEIVPFEDLWEMTLSLLD